jgi:DNA-binding MarR family transcriptional regulator
MDFEELQKMRQENIGRLLQRAARDYSELALAKLEKRGHGGLTLFHTTLISYLDMEGTQISVLAERAGVSKQAMGQVAKELEERQYLMRVADPHDKRAVLLQFTPLGTQFLQDAYQVKLEIEAEYTQILGEENFALLRQLLANLLERE